MQWLPTADYLHECFDYDPVTGVLTWKTRPLSHFKNEWACNIWNFKFSGKPAGGLSTSGHIRISVDNRRIYAHRLAWVMRTRKWPVEEIDHANGNPADNRWENLREASKQEQQWNRHQRGSLPRGVCRSRNKRLFLAYITEGKGRHRSRYIGSYGTPEEAHAAWLAAVREERGEFFRAD